jgi:hypothetical protein
MPTKVGHPAPLAPPVTRGEGGGTSLDLYGELSHPPQQTLSQCPRKSEWTLVNLSTGEVAPASCKAAFCDFCGPREAYKVGLAIGLAEPERHGTITYVGEDWKTVQARMNRVRYDLAQRYAVEWVWMVETNPKGTGHHVHFWQHGDYVPQGRLQEVTERRGMGIPWIAQWQAKKPSGEGVDPVSYGLKSVGYGMKAVQGNAGLAEHLANNGGRLSHHSRGFYRHGKGGPRLTKGDAVRAAVRAVHPDSEGDQWVLRRNRPSQG